MVTFSCFLPGFHCTLYLECRGFYLRGDVDLETAALDVAVRRHDADVAAGSAAARGPARHRLHPRAPAQLKSQAAEEPFYADQAGKDL